jgi:hypothetical protein
MPGTGSIRTAMRCSSSDVMRAVRAALPVPALMLSLALAACTTSVTRAFIPDPNVERMSLADAQDNLDRFVRLECPRLMREKHDTDDARISVNVDAGGNVTRATFSKLTGDERIDTMFGGIAAQMKFAPAPDGREFTGRMRVGYACSPTVSTATIQLIQ